jgi:WD40 repeat protein
VYVYETTEDGKYKLYKDFIKHSSYVQAMDWALDSSYIRSASGDYEKLYFNITDKVHDPSGASNTKDTVWASHNVKIAWDVMGIHPAGEDGTHINGVSISPDNTLIVSADDFGLINIFNYPVLNNEHKSRSYAGHSEHVLRVVFSKDGNRLYSVGGQDETLI